MNKQRKILFVAHTMNIGGVEKALLGELSHYSPEEWDVHVALLEQKGGLLNNLPDYVKVSEIDYYAKNKAIFNNPPLQNICDALKSANIVLAVKLMFAYVALKLTGSQRMLYHIMFKNVPIEESEYDVACAYAGPFPFIDYYVIDKIKAKEKQVWIHYDISKINIDKGIINKLYHYYDKINIVSQQGKEIFDNVFPSFACKTRFYPNEINSTDIKLLADGIDNPFGSGINVVTVGRVSKEKGQMMTLEALNLLLQAGLNIKWHYVGEGGDLQNCKDKAIELGVDGACFFHGLKKNPYPYMKYCDIYVQPSFYECYCTTIVEAKIFNKPIIATDFTGAREQLENYNSPWRICNHSPQEIADAIKSMI